MVNCYTIDLLGNEIKFLLWNANGLRNKTHYLQHIIENQHPHILAITETKLAPSIGDAELCSGYTYYRRDRRTGIGVGGGVLIAVSDRCPLVVTDCFVSESSEIISLCLDCNGYRFNFACYYRPPKQADFNDLLVWYEEATCPNIIIAGDFNLPAINWSVEKGVAKSNDNRVAMHRKFIDFVEINGLRQTITIPTHTDGNVLDLVISNLNIGGFSCEPSISDHHIIFNKIIIPSKHNIKDTVHTPRPAYFQFNKANQEKLDQSFSDIYFEIQHLSTQPNTSTEQLWSTFRDLFIRAIEQAIPRRVTCNKRKPWITRGTIRQLRKRNRLFKTFVLTQTEESKVRLKTHARHCKKLVEADYRGYINNHICKELNNGNTKPLFKYIENRRKLHNTIKSINNCAGNTPFEIANTFAVAFASVFTENNGQFSHCIPECEVQFANNPIQFNPHGVHKLLKNLDARKGSGSDGLSAALLKFSADGIYQVLTVIMQHSYDTSTVPFDWRNARVVPIFKNKGSRECPLNYRPISLTSITSKLIEHVIAHDIRAYLESNKILSERQHGFRPNHSCDSQLLITKSELVNNYNNNDQTDLIVLDFSKAFDVVPFTKLIYKLKMVGINDMTIHWIENWLHARQMSVVVEGIGSDPQLVTSGVPQGSVLGPLLFLIYINDMPDVVKYAQLRLFADDSLLYHKIKSKQDQVHLQEDLRNLEKWSKDWQMNFNVSKCEHLSIARTEPVSTSYSLNGKDVQQVTTIRYLGINIDQKLNNDEQVQYVAKKATSTLYMLMRALNRATSKTRSQAFKSICRPIIEYASCAWSPHQARHIQKLESINRKSFRWAYKIKWKDPISLKMKVLNWHTLEDRRSEIDKNMLSRILSDNIAIDIRDHVLFSNMSGTRKGAIRKSISCDVAKYWYFNRILAMIGSNALSTNTASK